MRMFAGPNGSGKSVLKSCLPTSLLGVYLNPDEIEADVKMQGYLDMKMFGVETTAENVLPAFTESELLIRQRLSGEAASLSYTEGRLHFPARTMNSYFASVAAEFLRQQLLNCRATFTFETVMSHPGGRWNS